MQDGDRPPQELNRAPVTRRAWIRKAGLATISISALVLLVCVQESLAHLLIPADIEPEAVPNAIDVEPHTVPQASVDDDTTEEGSTELTPPANTGRLDPFEEDKLFVDGPDEQTAEPDQAGYVRMPNFQRLRYGEARRQARELGLEIRRRGQIPTIYTRVRRQSVDAGSLVAPGTEVSVYLRDPSFVQAIIGY